MRRLRRLRSGVALTASNGYLGPPYWECGFLVLIPCLQGSPEKLRAGKELAPAFSAQRPHGLSTVPARSQGPL